MKNDRLHDNFEDAVKETRLEMGRRREARCPAERVPKR